MQPVSWYQARRIAADLDPAPPHRVGLESAVGAVLAQPVAALADLPATPSAAVAGWAVNGIGPWTITTDGPLHDGTAQRIGVGLPLPDRASAVLDHRSAVVEHGGHTSVVMVGQGGVPNQRPGLLAAGTGIANVGSSARQGEILIKPGGRITAGTIALAAAAGMDELQIVPPAVVAPVLLESTLLATGPPRRGRDRDVVAALLPTWVMGSGARCLPTAKVAAGDRVISGTIEGIGADLTVLTGTSVPGVDPSVPAALELLGAEVLIDQLAAEPAADVILAELQDGRRILALPGEPAAAVVALALLLTPMLLALSAQTPNRWSTVMLRDGVPATGPRERAVAVAVERGELADLAMIQPWAGPHGLGALAAADGIAFLDPGRGARGDSVPMIRLPG